MAEAVPPRKTAEVSGGSGGAARGHRELEAATRGRARRLGARGAGVWLEVGQCLLWESGTRRALRPPFQFRRCPPPRAGGSAAPRANEWRMVNLERERARDPNCQNCGGGGDGRDPSSLFPPARPTGFRDKTGIALAPTRWSASPEGVVSVCSQSFFLAPSPGWLNRRGLVLDLRGAPQVFNDSLKVPVGKVERDEADVGRVSLLCKSRKGSWEPCGWPQASAPRRQQVGGGAAASPIPLPSLARCALAAGAERVRGLAVPPPPCSLTCLLRSAPGGPRHGLLEAAPAARPAQPPPRTPSSGGQ